jgi:hypothetical protein
MPDWKTIWDHEVAAFGRRTLPFSGKTRTYCVELDDRDQDKFSVRYDDDSEIDTWHISSKRSVTGL